MKKLKKETSIKAVSKKKLSVDIGDKNKVGRPPVVLSDEQIKEVEELATNMTITQIADYFGISESTFHRMREVNFDILTAYKKGKSKGIKEATNLLWVNMKAGDTTSIIFYLKTQAGWNEKQLVETKDTTPKQPPNRNFYVNEKPEHKQND